jgi:hypothetical protein
VSPPAVVAVAALGLPGPQRVFAQVEVVAVGVPARFAVAPAARQRVAVGAWRGGAFGLRQEAALSAAVGCAAARLKLPGRIGVQGVVLGVGEGGRLAAAACDRAGTAAAGPAPGEAAAQRQGVAVSSVAGGGQLARLAPVDGRAAAGETIPTRDWNFR